MTSKRKYSEKYSVEILQSMKNAKCKKDVSQEEGEEENAKYPTSCGTTPCLVCARETPFWLLTRNPTWSSIMRVVFFALMHIYPGKKYFSLRTDVYQFVVDHWSKICVSKKRSENWKKQLQDTLSHNKKLFISGYEQYKQNGYWGLKQVIDPWEVTDNPDEDENEEVDVRVLEFRAMKKDTFAALAQIEESISSIRDQVEDANNSNDVLSEAEIVEEQLKDLQRKTDQELKDIEEEMKGLYQENARVIEMIANIASNALNSNAEPGKYFSSIGHVARLQCISLSQLIATVEKVNTKDDNNNHDELRNETNIKENDGQGS